MERNKMEGLREWNALEWFALASAWAATAYVLLTIVFAVKAVTNPKPE
jgi:hypothetical protein